jgi:hypothetical protein
MMKTWTAQPIMKQKTYYAIPATQKVCIMYIYTADTNLKKFKFLPLEAWDVANSKAYDIQVHNTFKETVNFLAINSCSKINAGIANVNYNYPDHIPALNTRSLLINSSKTLPIVQGCFCLTVTSHSGKHGV